jgi:hypothetical protein
MDSELDFKLLFEESPDILLVLLPDAPRYTMVAATGARWRATHRVPKLSGAGCSRFFRTIPTTLPPAAPATCARPSNAY